MISDILCPPCAKATREIFPRDNPERGGYVKFVAGHARDQLTCFQCRASIAAGEDAVAFSVYTDQRPYEPWETEYLKINSANQEQTRCDSK